MAKNVDRQPTHPGALLREDVLPALGVSISQAAKDMDTTRQNLHRILREEGPVTADMAVRLGAYCGNGPGLWLRMQTAYDLWKASRDMKVQAREIKKRSPVVAQKRPAEASPVVGARTHHQYLDREFFKLRCQAPSFRPGRRRPDTVRPE